LTCRCPSTGCSPPRTSCPIDAYADITLDLVVDPDTTLGVLITMEAGDGITYLAFRKATNTTL